MFVTYLMLKTRVCENIRVYSITLHIPRNDGTTKWSVNFLVVAKTHRCGATVDRARSFITSPRNQETAEYGHGTFRFSRLFIEVPIYLFLVFACVRKRLVRVRIMSWCRFALGTGLLSWSVARTFLSPHFSTRTDTNELSVSQWSANDVIFDGVLNVFRVNTSAW